MKKILTCVFLFACIHCFAGDGKAHRDSLNRIYTNDSLFSFKSPKGYLPMLLHNFGEQAAAPFHFTGNQWCMVGAGALATGILLISDQDIDNRVTHLKEDYRWINTCSPHVTKLGDNYGGILLAGVGAYSLVCKDHRALHTTLLATQAMITSGVWTRIGKTLAGRERPSISYWFPHHEGGDWHGPFSQYISDEWKMLPQSGFDAFPSGHTSTVFSMATVFAMQYRDKPVIPVIAYTAATAVAVTRMIEHTHWASDVFVGGVIGYFCGKQVVRHHQKLYGVNESSLHASRKNKTEVSYAFDYFQGVFVAKAGIQF